MLKRIEPVQPLIEAIARARGEGDVFDFRMHFAGVFQGELGIELQVRKQVGLREEHQGSAVEDAGILEGLVFAFGHAEKDDLRVLAKVVAGRADQIANVLDQQQTRPMKTQFVEVAINHAGIEMARSTCDDLAYREAKAREPSSVIVGLQITR